MTLMSGREETNRASFRPLAHNSEISGEALERERTDVAGAATVRQEGVVASHIAGSNVDDDGKSDSEDGPNGLLSERWLRAWERRLGALEARWMAGGLRAQAAEQFLEETAVVANEKADVNPAAAVLEETAVVANEKAGEILEAEVPEGKVGVARTNPEEAHASLGERTFGERGTEVAGAAAVRQGGVVAPRIAGNNVDGDIKSDSGNGFKKLIFKLPLPEEKRRQQEAPKQCLRTGESEEAGTGEVEEWS
eukprot:CAMPEP_0171902916 /NCGR_PEP_ID=MMETSP0993-20121228/2256_1 /TAXON_ID=483369 /ORGANISM="non described non described, Strain CCMP2098" /LENGTH=250 /DNA_ID=CAMNT_0012532737 /DNA_START=59 /DNA_END=808 /DNA_ORIENTATION=-